jgi:hypothetical protein
MSSDKFQRICFYSVLQSSLSIHFKFKFECMCCFMYILIFHFANDECDFWPRGTLSVKFGIYVHQMTIFRGVMHSKQRKNDIGNKLQDVKFWILKLWREEGANNSKACFTTNYRSWEHAHTHTHTHAHKVWL